MTPATKFVLGEESTGIEHIIDSEEAMTGVLPQKSYPDSFEVVGGTQDNPSPTVEVGRKTITVGPPDGGTATTTSGATVAGNGLFDPYAVFNNVRGKHVWVSAIEVRYSDGGAAKAWSCSVTSGLSDGTATTTVDDPGYDVTLLSGTANTVTKAGYEMLPGRKIRVIADAPAAGETLRIAVMFTLVNGPSGRLIA